MLVNLLSNAVKFTPAGGRVSLAVAARPADGRVMLSVADTGIGIAASDLPKLFRPFSQLDSSLARQHQGSGLGLVLVKRLAELHGGALTVASEPGVGSTFTIELPQGAVPRAEPEREPALPGHGLRTALVVADSPAAADQLAGLLRELALVCEICPPGPQLADAVSERRPDVIFLDMLAPTAEALLQLRRLQSDPRVAATPVIVVAIGDEQARWQQAGAANCLTRPVSRARLHDALARLAPAAAVSPPSSPPRGRVLVVDDNQLNLDMLSGYLEDKGFDVALATSGEQSIAAVQASRPDIILMDIQMPGIDGLEVIRRLRGDARFAALPVVAVSALAMPGDRERCLAAGATSYMSKPVSLRALKALIEQLLAGAGRPEET
jgi:CheY-like chemotaxis protein